MPIQDLIAVTKGCLVAEGASDENAQIVAEVLVAADSRLLTGLDAGLSD